MPRGWALMFLDTSGLLCFHHRAERQHAEAVRLFQSAAVRLTHNYVLSEYVALAHARKLPRQAVLSFVADLQDDPAVQVIWVRETLHRAAVTHLQQRLDKDWSLCDAVSFSSSPNTASATPSLPTITSNKPVLSDC